MAAKKKAHGLLLDLGGAGGWHSVQGVYGMFHPNVPTPVGGIGEPTLDQAKAWDGDPGMPLKLVKIDSGEVPKAREAAAGARRRQNRGEED